MNDWKTIYHVEGSLCRDFIGQISYTVCLDERYDELDIAFTFDKQHFQPEDITPEFLDDLLTYCREQYQMELKKEPLWASPIPTLPAGLSVRAAALR